MDEIIRFCQRQPRHFIERDLNKPLSKKGFEVCLKQSLSLHELILDRFDAMPSEVKEAIALASMQGQRFLTSLTAEVAQALEVPNVEAGLNGAEHPHSLVNGVPSGIAEFAQRTARALAALTRMELARYDYATALQIAQRFLAGVEADSWHFNALNFSQLWDVQTALHTMGQVAASQQAAHAMLESAQNSVTLTPSDKRAQRNLSVSWSKLGDIALQQGEIDGAKPAFQKGLEIRKALAGELNTPEARRDLAVPHAKLARLAEAKGEFERALQGLLDGLEQASIYQTMMPSPDADQVVAYFEGDIQRLQGASGRARA
ncbi:hypothetical protein DJ031_09830 [bacterium endosymbiont of Escarpia laminata]|nr:MAG: hypothetical protein DJ031_09830 [bacterium endosymbiont of Escarpia laminata]